MPDAPASAPAAPAPNTIPNEPANKPANVINPDPTGAVGAGNQGIPADGDEKAPSLRDSIKAAVEGDKASRTPKDDKGEGDKAVKSEKDDTKAAKDDKASEKDTDPKADDKAKPVKEGENDKVNPVKDDTEREDSGDKGAEPGESAPNGSNPDKSANGNKGRRTGAPESFMPDSKEVWKNVPRAVERDIHSYIARTEQEIEAHKAATASYEEIREFDEAIRANGGNLRESLVRVAQLESLVQSNPIAGINKVLQDAGPRKADGSPISLMEFAKAIVQLGDQGYNQAMQQAQAQQQQQSQPQEDPRIAAMQQEVAQLREQTVNATVIEPFKAEHPRYDELQNHIALFLKSGMIDTSLSPVERLGIAYDMAARVNPVSNISDQGDEGEPASDDRVASFDGSKSIKSTPGAVSQDEPNPGSGSIRDTLRANLKRTKRS